LGKNNKFVLSLIISMLYEIIKGCINIFTGLFNSKAFELDIAIIYIFPLSK
jgi:hypothetical protein